MYDCAIFLNRKTQNIQKKKKTKRCYSLSFLHFLDIKILNILLDYSNVKLKLKFKFFKGKL